MSVDRSSREEGIIVVANLVAYAVHRVGDLVVRMARNVFIERRCVDFTPGSVLAPGQSLRAFEDVVGN